MPLKRPVTSSGSTLGMVEASWSRSALAAYPSLMEFCASSIWPDGSKRVPGTLQISTGGCRWQGKLKDLESKRYAFLTAESVDDLLAALDRACETGEADWRADEWTAKRSAAK